LAELDGVWRVERTGGMLPPLFGIRKVIDGARGRTSLGRLPGVRFDVVGLELHYRPPFGAFVDVLEREGGGYRGRATFGGREFGRFRLSRVE
jgi:hypothetical protein